MKARVLTVGLVGVALLAFGVFCHVKLASHRSYVLSRPISAVSAPERALRPLYPYSIVPGGVYSPAELRDRIRQDRLVAEHYRDFNQRDTRLVVLDRDALAFVSYRIHDKVFWTRRKLLIPKGETLLTDGQHYARTRCGNRLSDTRPPNAAFFNGIEPIASLGLPQFSLPEWQSGRLRSFELPPGATPLLARVQLRDVDPFPTAPILDEGGPTGPAPQFPFPPIAPYLTPNAGLITAAFPSFPPVERTPVSRTPETLAAPVAARILNAIPEPGCGGITASAIALLLSLQFLSRSVSRIKQF